MKRAEDIYVSALKMVVAIIIGLAACRFSNGYAFFPLILIACFSAVRGRAAVAWCIYFFILFTMNVSNGLVPKESMAWGVGSRSGIVAISLALIIGSAKRRGPFRLPFEGMLLFLVAAVFSFYDSWVLQISALKLMLFSLFFFGMWRGSQNLQEDWQGLQKLRAFILAIVFVLVFGSIIAYPFPHISFSTTFRYALREGATASDIKAMFDAMEGKVLFSGITVHSQTLAPFLAAAFTWLFCDTLFVERRFRWLHSLLLLAILPLLYMTRSRVALVSFLVAVAMIFFFTKNKIAMNISTKRHLNRLIVTFGVLLLVGAVALEVRSSTLTQWIRKTDDVKGDTRTLSEALTSSREGAIEDSIEEFKRNPFVGSGFQVAWYSRESLLNAGGGFVISSSIEKGILPTMILGETGVVGFAAFGFFLVYFYTMCQKKHYYIVMTTFTTLLATNIGEATFFSPSGGGGVEWMFTVMGGFVLDTLIVCRRGMPRIIKGPTT